MSRKWKPSVIVGGGQPKPVDPDPVTSAFGHALDRWVSDYLLRHTSLSKDAALIVLMQHAAGVAVVRGCPEPDYVRCSTDLYQMEHAARVPKNGA